MIILIIVIVFVFIVAVGLTLFFSIKYKNSLKYDNDDDVEDDVYDELFSKSSGEAYVEITNNSPLTMETNQYPNWVPDGTILTRTGGVYVKMPTPQSTLTLELDITKDSNALPTTEFIIYDPTFSVTAYLGRPNEQLPENHHWSIDYPPQELLPLDVLSVEAWDEEAHDAGPYYEGILRFNINTMVLQNWDDVTYFDGDIVNVKNDSYYAHTQPNGKYHIHNFKASEFFDYSNKVIGYTINGYAIMGTNTKIYQPTFNDNNVAVSYTGSETKPAVSGYEISPDYQNLRKSQNPQNGSKNDIPTDRPGLFHVDYIYTGDANTNNSFLLDKYNMGFTNLMNYDGTTTVQKVFVQTVNYPYVLHSLYE